MINVSEHQGSPNSALKEDKWELHKTFGHPASKPPPAQWRNEDLLEGFFEDVEDTDDEDTGADEDKALGSSDNDALK